jgi:hypothetical protein
VPNKIRFTVSFFSALGSRLGDMQFKGTGLVEVGSNRDAVDDGRALLAICSVLKSSVSELVIAFIICSSLISMLYY